MKLRIDATFWNLWARTRIICEMKRQARWVMAQFHRRDVV